MAIGGVDELVDELALEQSTVVTEEDEQAEPVAEQPTECRRCETVTGHGEVEHRPGDGAGEAGSIGHGGSVARSVMIKRWFRPAARPG